MKEVEAEAPQPMEARVPFCLFLYLCLSVSLCLHDCFVRAWCHQVSSITETRVSYSLALQFQLGT